MKFKKGDQIIITAGKDKGKRGKIERIYPKQGSVLLPGLNIFKRHLKRRDEKNPGGIIDLPRPVSIANIALICSKCGQPSRIGYLSGNGEKQRICKKCNKTL